MTMTHTVTHSSAHAPARKPTTARASEPTARGPDGGWTDGNDIRLLENGEAFYPRVFEAIANARLEVRLETFILFDDKVGRQLHAVLLAAAQRGVQVDVLIDGWGSPDLGPNYLSPLLDAGVRVHVFDPVKRLFGTRLNLFRRMHRKVVVIDAERAFVGGINYSIDHLAEFGPEAKQDYAVEVRGPLVAQIHDLTRTSLKPPAVGERWRRLFRRRHASRTPSDRTAALGTARARLSVRDNHGHPRDIETQYRHAIRHARQRIVIANAYFFPGYRLLRDLRRAARRGVDVRLILQGQPDMPIVKTAASLLYRHLDRAGVRIFEYGERPLHGKVAIVDDNWATVGSSNLDPTSLALNLEANVVVLDHTFNASLMERLQHLMDHSCRPVELAPLSALQSAWAQLRGAVVFFALRRFPSWIQGVPASVPSIQRASCSPRAVDEDGMTPA
jgi:cardiolipin synthase A/B